MSTYTERRQRVRDRGTLEFLEISAPSLPETLRIVNDNQNWTSQGVEYIGVGFEITLPNDVSGQPARAELVIDNTGRSLTEDLEGLAPGEMIIGKLMLADRAAPDVHEQTFFLPMMHVSVVEGRATAKLGQDYLTRQQAVQMRLDRFTAPGLH